MVTNKPEAKAMTKQCWNPCECICENRKCLKIIVDTSVITCGEVVHVMGIVLTKMTDILATNVSTNFGSKKIRYKLDCYNLHIVFLVIILPLIVIIICYLFAKKLVKTERH